MNITIQVDNNDCANEVMEALRYRADSLTDYPGTADMIRKISDQIEEQIDDGTKESYTIEEPVFPKAFLKHCPQVKANGGDESMAECAFNPAGAGMMCENCSLHLTSPFIREEHEVDREFLPQIQEYYRNVDEYEASINTSVP